MIGDNRHFDIPRADSRSYNWRMPSPRRKSPTPRTINAPGAISGPLPARIQPKLATATDCAPAGDKWLHEIKHDGYRLMCWVENRKSELRTRGEHDWTGKFPEIAKAAGLLPAQTAILDGEVTALGPTSISNYALLKEYLSRKETGDLVYFVFDLLYLNGHDLRGCPLEARKTLLAELLRDARQPRLQYVDHLVGDGAEFFGECGKMGLEGIVSKRRDVPYRSGRGKDWLKVKCLSEGEFVIGGYTEADSRDGFRALVLGRWNDRSELVYIGRVGTGFTDRLLTTIRTRLDGIAQRENPFANVKAKHFEQPVHWVQPMLVAQVRYSTWTGDGKLRHPVFIELVESAGP